MPNLLVCSPANNNPIATFVFAHGAGAAMDSEFMTCIAHGLAQAGIKVIRFEFPYMALRRKTGSKRPPNKMDVLLQAFEEVIVQAGNPENLFIGGKSMGGRVASMLATHLAVRGVVAYGYPFHPIKKPDKLRIEHLSEMTSPLLIVQGERDSLGSKDEVLAYNLNKKIKINWIPDGDHSLKPRKKSGFTYNNNLQESVDVTVAFMKKVTSQ